MRRVLARHGPALSGLAAMVLIAGALGTLFPAAPTGAAGAGGGPVAAIPLPGPGEDADLDSYADASDLTDGDLVLRLELRRLQVPGRAPEPYVVAGTQDDHGRTGRGAELEWRHVVDYDALGRKPGSPRWYDQALRTGAWVVTLPGAGLADGAGKSGALGSGAQAPETLWPQTLRLNVRDDRPSVRVELEAWDAGADPHRLAGAWTLDVRVNGTVQAGDRTVAFGEDLRLGTLAGGPEGADAGAGLEVRVAAETGLPAPLQRRIAERWAPELRFDSGESLYPVAGEVLEDLSGFTGPRPELRTWTLAFNNGRHGYRLALPVEGAVVDHSDVLRLLSDLAAAGNSPSPTVYAGVMNATNDRLVVQYWFFYMYNYVLDDAGRDIAALAHAGDREFFQLEFSSLQDALNGTPDSITYSQHYKGVRVEGPTLGAIPLAPGRPVIYVARGSHASYPAPGDDLALRPAFAGYHDEFDGQGLVLGPDGYHLEVLGNQPWHAGYLWGPATRYGRQLGTSFQPLLQYDFRYPWTDPLHWQASVEGIGPGDIEALYGSRTE